MDPTGINYPMNLRCCVPTNLSQEAIQGGMGWGCHCGESLTSVVFWVRVRAQRSSERKQNLKNAVNNKLTSTCRYSN